jgi:proline iminopeptidase
MELRAAVNGTELAYVLHGEGRPLLTMHGGLGLDHTYFRPWLDGLGDVAQLIYYDQRGQGRSQRTASLDHVGHDTWAADAEELCAHLGHERVVLFGHSYGGYLAQDYALKFGERLAGLILCSTGPAFDYPQVVFANAERRGTAEQLAVLQSAMTSTVDDEGFRRAWMTILPMYFKRFDPAIAMEMDRNTRYSGAAFCRGMQKCLPSFNTLSRLNELKCPTLILTGADDWIAPPVEGAERLKAGIANSEVTIFEDSGHFPFIEEPERFKAVVREWLQKLP